MQLASTCRKCPYTGHLRKISKRLIFIQKSQICASAVLTWLAGVSHHAARCAESPRLTVLQIPRSQEGGVRRNLPQEIGTVGDIKCNLMINPKIGHKSVGDREIVRK